MIELYKEKKWSQGPKKAKKLYLSDEGTEAACLAIGAKLTAISGPKPDDAPRQVCVPFFAIDGFHQAIAIAAQYLQGEMKSRSPIGRYFWCHVLEDSENATWLIEAGAYS